MMSKLLKTFVIVGVVAGVIVACAEYPEKASKDELVSTADMEAGNDRVTGISIDSMAVYNNEEVRLAVADAEAAIELAEKSGSLWSHTEGLLEQAQEALARGDINNAVELAIAAEQEAKLADNQTKLESANYMLNQLKTAHPDLAPDMLEKIADAENAYLEDNGVQALEIATALIAQAGLGDSSRMASREHNKEKMLAMESKAKSKKMMASTTPVALGGEVRNGTDQYKVAPGDSLWGISSKPAIYDNPYQWPLIYKANKSQISDPDLIRPGQQLAIDRQATPAEVERAINHAKHRGAWVLGSAEASDTDYLLKSEQSGVASR